MGLREMLERIRDTDQEHADYLRDVGGVPDFYMMKLKMAKALLAVLDLHVEDKFGECKQCRTLRFPCPTVQAIQREMGEV